MVAGGRRRQQRLFEAVLAELDTLGYTGELLKRDYRLRDWFSPDHPERTVPAAAFGQTPVSYETACIAVLRSNGKAGPDLLSDFRALGAPLAFEVRDDCVVPWGVGRTPSQHGRRPAIGREAVRRTFRDESATWSPESILRAKNISKPAPRQLDFFDIGLIAALEEHVRDKLDPLLRDALSEAETVYGRRTRRRPNAQQLFKLGFWLLAGKVFRDREVRGFMSLGPNSDPDDVLERVAQHYHELPPRLLDHDTREVVHRKLWTELDFRNLSVDVLTHIWSTTFVSDALRRKLGIHSTPRTIAKYVVDRLPFEELPEDERIVVEPCCGSGTFLLAAQQRLRDLLPYAMTPRQRHEYFKRLLVGFEQDVFAVEVSRLSLTLADFPNPNGWQLNVDDVFNSAKFLTTLKSARVVLCNPPHEDFSPASRSSYKPRSTHKPVELLHRVLDNLHADGILGFVLPRQVLDGRGYAPIRERLVERFRNIEVVSLPDVAFETADQETVLLTASGPRSKGNASLVNHRKVQSADWDSFRLMHMPTRQDSESITVSAASRSIAVPDLRQVWASLTHLKRLDEIARVTRGIEWNKPLTTKCERTGRRIETGNREKLVSPKRLPGFREGIPSLPKSFHAFQCPPTMYLSMKPEDQRGNAYKRPWDQPKVILNAKTKSRGPWRLAAVPDSSGLVCYQTLTAVWPSEPSYVVPLAAVLNGPVANAFVASREGKRDIKNMTLGAIPVPRLSTVQTAELDSLVKTFRVATMAESWGSEPDYEEADRILRRIDAVVLQGYDLSPRFEREVLEYFRGCRRVVPFAFGDYFPPDFKPFVPLHEYISDDYRRSTAPEMRHRYKPVSSPATLAALDMARELFAEE